MSTPYNYIEMVSLVDKSCEIWFDSSSNLGKFFFLAVVFLATVVKFASIFRNFEEATFFNIYDNGWYTTFFLCRC